MTKIGSCLSWFLAEHHGLRVNKTEGVYHDLPFDTLDRIHHHCNRSLIQSFKTLQFG
ncbi:hypothetical protein HanRHA438_Chr16g0748111 [Helianthus annuus]|nr:hypothetical protein HanRHA438_Chr16g0748111 [Helianthus annuus]